MEKTKQTLYNFISLRSPQSVTNKEKEFRFIEMPKCETHGLPQGLIGRLKQKLSLNEDLKMSQLLERLTDSKTSDSYLQELEDYINEDAGIKIPRPHKKCSETTDKEKHPPDFTHRAEYIAQHKSSINYDYLEKMLCDEFRNIKSENKCEKVKFLFDLLIENLNTSKDFGLKEKIGDWLVLWNLINKLAEPNPKVAGEQKLNEEAKKYISQLLNATIILPIVQEEESDEKNKPVAIEKKGPIYTNFTQKNIRGKSAIVLSDELNKKHENNLIAFQLSIDKGLSEDDISLLKTNFLRNIDFSTPKRFYSGSLIDTESNSSALGINASILKNGGKFYLYITPNSDIGNGKTPKSALVRIQAGDEYDYGSEIKHKLVINDKRQWFIELSDDKEKSLNLEKYESLNLFVSLKYVNEIAYSTSIEMARGPGNRILEGAAELFNCEGIYFESEIIFDPATKIPSLKISQFKIPVTNQNKPAKINIQFNTDLNKYFFDEQTISAPTDQFKLEIDKKEFVRDPKETNEFDVSILITFNDGEILFSQPFKIKLKDNKWIGSSFFVCDSDSDAYGKTYAPKGFGITQLGVADYQRVVSHVIRYEAAEVAHIENLMAREYKEKVITKEHITEITDFESLETETEKLNDATSAERFQMQTEIAKIQQEDKKNSLEAQVNYDGGTGTSLQINYANATNSSREESTKQAVTTAKELTNRAMERIVSKVKTERTRKVTDRLTDVSKHGFDNRGSSDHVSGVYRYINAIYKNEIENYGRRLAYEFAIPEPSKLHRLGLKAGGEFLDITELKKPDDPRNIVLNPLNPDKFFSWDQLDKINYIDIANKYDADVTPYPEDTKAQQISGALGKQSNISSFTTDVEIEKNYQISEIRFQANNQIFYQRPNPVIDFKIFGVGHIIKVPLTPWIASETQIYYHDEKFTLAPPIPRTEKIIITCDQIDDCIFTVYFTLKLSLDATQKWQKEVYKQIIDAYEERLVEYNAKVAEIKQEAEETFEANPLQFRQIEQTILRMNCISYLIAPFGQFKNRNFGNALYESYPDGAEENFTNTRVKKSHDLDEYAAFVKFIEQAFEWNIMSYSFYPFYWANSESWKNLYQTDYNDPIFKSFMQAGMARVVVTVRPGFEFAVLLYMITGKIWANGHVPVYGDNNYVSIANELKDPPYTIDEKESWETILPTNLLALQKSGAVVNSHGLPNFEEKQNDKYDNFESHDTQMSVIVKNDERVLSEKRRGFWAWLFGN